MAVQTFALLADATRVRIVWHLGDEELSVNDLAGRVERAPATVSQHLTKLRLAGIVAPRRVGTFVYYRLADVHVGELVAEALGHADHLSTDEGSDDFPRGSAAAPSPLGAGAGSRSRPR